MKRENFKLQKVVMPAKSIKSCIAQHTCHKMNKSTQKGIHG
jgi:hypothetical protein